MSDDTRPEEEKQAPAQVPDWDVLRETTAPAVEQQAPNGIGQRVAAWWKQAAGWQKGLATFAVLGSVAFLFAGVALAAAVLWKTLHPQPQAVAAAAVTATPQATSTPAPTATPVPTPTPTPVPRLVVWSRSGSCAYARPAPSADNNPQACVPNSTEVIDTGEREQGGGFTWAKVQYPKNGYMAIGWMALNVVVWPVSPNSKTGAKWASLYDANKAVVQEALSPHTPVVILDDEGDGWLWVQLPDNTKGYLKAKDLE